MNQSVAIMKHISYLTNFGRPVRPYIYKDKCRARAEYMRYNMLFNISLNWLRHLF